MNVLALVGGILACAFPWRLWPRGFRAPQVPPFARYFPVVALAFYSVPSVTFPQYMVCVLPAVALGAGVLSAKVPARWVVVHVAVASGALLTGALIAHLATHLPDVVCSRVEVTGEKPAFFEVWFRRDPGALACIVTAAACQGAGLPIAVPRGELSHVHVLAALRERSLGPLTNSMCLVRE